MAEKPILFNTEMVEAILEGRKTVTRRVIKQNIIHCCDFDTDGTICGCCDKDGDWYEIEDFAPYQICDILYVRETWSKSSFGYIYRTDNLQMITDNDEELEDVKWHPSIHMPKEAARIWLKVTDVRVERLQDMKTEDFYKEGVVLAPFDDADDIAKSDFVILWDSTIKKQDLDRYGWDASPYVWVIEFERMKVERK